MKRITSIDATRGFVMLLMLVDHVREYFYSHIPISDPIDVNTPIELFYTRLSTHLCAPIFVALTGLSAWLYVEKQGSVKKGSEFLFKRGLILILFELTIINFGWRFDFPFKTLYLQVIWVIGISMIVMSGLIYLRHKWIVICGLIIVLGHNLLDPITFQEGEFGYTFWSFVHDRGYIDIWDGFRARTSYPVLAWIGVMALGFGIGPWFKTPKRLQYLWVTSGLSLTLFLILRTINIYGDPYPWSHSLMSFLNVTKYPPSADYVLLTLSIGLFAMGAFEKWEGRLNFFLSTYGSVPMFYYIGHIYTLAMLHKLSGGGSVSSVAYVWLIAALLAVPFFFACRWYGVIKKRYPNSYLKYL